MNKPAGTFRSQGHHKVAVNSPECRSPGRSRAGNRVKIELKNMSIEAIILLISGPPVRERTHSKPCVPGPTNSGQGRVGTRPGLYTDWLTQPRRFPGGWLPAALQPQTKLPSAGLGSVEFHNAGAENANPRRRSGTLSQPLLNKRVSSATRACFEAPSATPLLGGFVGQV